MDGLSPAIQYSDVQQQHTLDYLANLAERQTNT